MEFGLYLRSFLTDRSRPLYEQIDELVEICHVARDSGFSAVTMPQHWVSHPTIWPQPFQVLARLAPETGDMRLLTGIVLLPLHNPVQMAEDVATLDHICRGRLTFGVGIGYRETELGAVGATRRDRVPRLAESIEIMKQLWSGEEVTYEGRYLDGTRCQDGLRPHAAAAPADMDSVSERRRSAPLRAHRGRVLHRPAGGILGPRRSGGHLPGGACTASGNGPGRLALTRGVAYGKDKATAAAEAQEAAASSYKMYSTWNMQEDTMLKINIDSDSQVEDWAVTGNGDDCLEQFAAIAEHGIDYVGMTFYNLPKTLEARKEYLQSFAENVIRRSP